MIEPELSPDEPKRLAALHATGQLDTPIEERFERVTRLAQRLLHTPVAAISLVDGGRQWFKSIQGLDVQQTSRAVSFCGHAILQDDVFVVQDARSDPRFSDNPLVVGDVNAVFYAGYPIRAGGGEKIGTLCVMDNVPRSPSGEELQVLRDLAAIAESEFAHSMGDSAQQEILREVQEIQRQSRVDSLTQTWNRNAIFEVLEIEIERARAGGHGVGVIMGDLDQFNHINDTIGHAGGDEVLRQAAKRLLGAVRTMDAVGRYGGEEFIVVLGKCEGLQEAVAIAERVRGRIAEAPFDTDVLSAPMTMSLGVVLTASAVGANADAVIREAGRALDRAKHRGRNCVEATLIDFDRGIGKNAA